ncbi:MAG: S49 family peptidase, partial [Variovorax sp.]
MTDPNRTEPQGFEPFEPASPMASAQGATKTIAAGDPTQA